ncbi:hypothetical protein TNCV_3063811 [Trichonephila clavipes]|nr:hypothetical protein TNCV_3063811 [Trichonephila clavipes]
MQTVLIGDVPKILYRVPSMARVPLVRHPCPRRCWLPLASATTISGFSSLERKGRPVKFLEQQVNYSRWRTTI